MTQEFTIKLVIRVADAEYMQSSVNAAQKIADEIVAALPENVVPVRKAGKVELAYEGYVE